MIFSELANQLRGRMSEKRYQHTIGVAETAASLARHYDANQGKAVQAALLHDIARDWSGEANLEWCSRHGIEADEVEMTAPDLLHAKVGVFLAREEFGITDPEVLNGIRYHTTGRKAMTLLEKIIFIADMIEPGRDFPGVGELRELVFRDIDAAVVAGLNSTIRHVLDRGLVIHPDSIAARNHLIKSR